MPERLPLTRPQQDDLLERLLTDAYNRQNTAERLRQLFEEWKFSAYNRAEDLVPADRIQGIAPLVKALISGQLPAAIAAALFEQTTPAALRALMAESKLSAGRSYEIVRPDGNVLVWAVGDTGRELSPQALWRNPETPGQLQVVSYDLAGDEISEPADGGDGGAGIRYYPAGYEDADILVTAGEVWAGYDGLYLALNTFTTNGYPDATDDANWRLLLSSGTTYTNAQAVAAVAATNAYQKLAGNRVVVVDALGNFAPFGNLTNALYYAADCAVYVYGSHDLGAAAVLGLPTGCTLHLTPGSYIRCREVYASQNGGDNIITGAGTLEAIVSQGPGSRLVRVENIVWKGRPNPFSFNSNGAPKRLIVENCELDSGTFPALDAQMGFGGNYQSPVAVEFYRNRITTTNAKVFGLYDNHVTDNGGTVELNPNNSLRLVGNVINAPASAVIVDRTGGPFVLKSNGNYITATGATVLTATGTAVTFDEERLWPVLTSGTYTVSPAGASPGVCVQLTLAAGCTEIQVPGAGFVKYAGSFVANAENSYSFLVRQDGKVSYYINQPAA